MNNYPTPDAILQLGFGFWGSKTLLSALELGLFSKLSQGAASADEIGSRLELHGRGLHDFLDALVSLGMLQRENGRYSNTPATDLFLDRAKPSYIGGILEMANARLYGFWGLLTEALRSGEPQNESKQGENFFAALYADPARLGPFLHAMTSLSMGANLAIARQFPWAAYQTFADIGTAQGGLPVQLARAHPHLSGCGFDLPPVAPHFQKFIGEQALAQRIRFQPGDFLRDPLPSADVLIMGHILHDWGLAEKQQLIAKAYAALPTGGALIIYEALIDDARSVNTFGLLMSLNMLIETPAGSDYTGAECCKWLRNAGFRETRVEHLVGPDSMVIGIK